MYVLFTVVHPAVLTQEQGASSKTSYSGPSEDQSSSSASTSTAPVTPTEGIIAPLPRKINEKQSSLSSFIRRLLNDRKTQEIHNDLVNLLIKNYLPIQLVDNEYFRSFVEKLNSNYQVRSRKTIANTLLPQLHNMARDNVRNSLDSINACCITTDGWTSCANKSFISVTAHYVTKDIKMKSSLLDCYEYSDRHTAENLCKELKRICREWNIANKIIAVASDNASNIVAAIKITGWKHVPYFAHNLNLIIQSALEVNGIAQMQNKIKKIVTFFKHSTQACNKLTAMQIQLSKPVLSLKQDCITRWNSTFDMFNRILQVKDSLMSVIAINYPMEISNIDNNDIIIIQGICNILKVFKDVTEEMSCEKQVTASTVILLSAALRKYCANYLKTNLNAPPEVKELGQKLLDNLNTRFHLIEDHKIYAKATFLDPRFKRQGFSKDLAFEAAKQSLIAQVAVMIDLERDLEQERPGNINAVESQANGDNDPKISIWKDFDEKVGNLVQKSNPKAAAIIEVNKYIEEPLQPRKHDPLEWWT
ncbi:hypothetical protein NQ314_016799 [Rhamnusium bicolor]|uniref:Zinc finger BED domain-containing protein 1 n=1 Tax=Rhamnusium bicolor TaxID=1586634 RepID=A0AAV8WUW0_9CUCU|nr:hypothetical protein NQ314_016799 [Rhamnusium bicolor]